MTIPEAKFLMWEVYKRMPAWKGDKLIEFYKTDQADLEVLGEATGILFVSTEMMREAVQCLERIRAQHGKQGEAKSGASKASNSHSSPSDEQGMSDDERSDDREKKKKLQAPSGGAASKTPNAGDATERTDKQDSKSSSKEPENTDQQKNASASSCEQDTKEKSASVSESHEDWFKRVTKDGQDVLWYPRAAAKCPTLLTGVKSSDLKCIDTMGWEGKLETANLEKHADYLRGRQFAVTPHLWKPLHGKMALFLRHTDYHPRN